MNAATDKAKYKRLHVAAQSYTEGFTSIMWPGFAHLASYAQRTGFTSFDIDFLQHTITPAPDDSVAKGFFDYRELPEWFDAVGCSLQHVKRFQMRAEFDPATTKRHTYERCSESYMSFHAHTEIDSDRGVTYSYNYDSGVWFDYTNDA